jgi:hypothetical protein
MRILSGIPAAKVGELKLMSAASSAKQSLVINDFMTIPPSLILMPDWRTPRRLNMPAEIIPFRPLAQFELAALNTE